MYYNELNCVLVDSIKVHSAYELFDLLTFICTYKLKSPLYTKYLKSTTIVNLN